MSPPSDGRVGRLRGRRTFTSLRRAGVRHRSGPIVITSLVDDAQTRACVGYAVPRVVGPAVTRNRLRRRLRAVARDLDLRPGLYLIAARSSAAELSYDELAAHVQQALAS